MTHRWKTDADSSRPGAGGRGQKLHDAGKHADSVTKADEAKVINLPLKK
jgi:hypothetical protein